MDMNLRSAMVMKDVNRRNTIPENATNLPQLPKKTMKAHIPGHSSIIFNDFFGHFGVNWRNLGASPQWYPGGTTDFASAENRGIARICCKVLDLDGGGISQKIRIAFETEISIFTWQKMSQKHHEGDQLHHESYTIHYL